MNDLDTTTEGTGERPLFTSRRHRKGRRVGPWLGLLALVALAVAGGWLWRRSHPGSQAARTAAADVPAAADTSAPSATPDQAGGDLPPLDASDEAVRRLTAGLSSRPEWARWLVGDGLIRRFVVAVTEIADGRSPRSHLTFMAPGKPFQTSRSGGRTVPAPASYRRYDLAAATVASLDTQGTAALYRRLEPLLDDAFRELGTSEGSFHDTLGRAFQKLLAVPVPDTPPQVVQDEGVYVYSDPRLEALDPAQKELLRMGPDNARRVQAKLRELAEALGFETPPAG